MKITIILIASVFIIGSSSGIAFSKSRLDSIDCGKRMSRLDAAKCEQIARAKSKSRENINSNSQGGNIIHDNQTAPEWDTQGRHYTPAGGGNLWRDDGTLMQKAAGGYIDTKTGQFVPAN